MCIVTRFLNMQYVEDEQRGKVSVAWSICFTLVSTPAFYNPQCQPEGMRVIKKQVGLIRQQYA